VLTIKFLYRVFEELYTTLEDAQIALEGWEHKEKIIPYYCVIDEEIFKESIEMYNCIPLDYRSVRMFHFYDMALACKQDLES
jgi:hypothetical protein